MTKRIVVTGMDYFAPVLVGNLNKYGAGLDAFHLAGKKKLVGRIGRLRDLTRADGVIFLGGSVRSGRVHRFLSFTGRLKRKKILMYWTGSDVLNAQKELKSYAGRMNLPKEIIHVAAAPWLVEELGGIGVRATFISLSAVPFVRIDLSEEVPPLPNDFTILTYVPDSAVLLYGGEHIKNLARDFPMVKIKILSSTGKWWHDPPTGVEFLGWVEDPRELYVQSTVLVRMTSHDAIGGMVQEALSYGRHAIWTYPLEGVRMVRDYDMLCSHMAELLEMHRRSELKINTGGIESVRNHFLPELNIKKLLVVMDI